MGCNGRIALVFFVAGLLPLVMPADSSVQRKWNNVPPPPPLICTTCATCENPCSQVPPPPPPVPPPPPPKPPQIECPPPPPPKPPQIECPPPPSSPFHYIFPPPNYPYNYPFDFFNGADPSLFLNKFNLVCLIGLLMYIFL